MKCLGGSRLLLDARPRMNGDLALAMAEEADNKKRRKKDQVIKREVRGDPVYVATEMARVLSREKRNLMKMKSKMTGTTRRGGGRRRTHTHTHTQTHHSTYHTHIIIL